jgi:hypothetical protein
MFGGRIVLLLTGAITICVMVIAFQHQIIKKNREDIRKQDQAISELIRGIALTESLRKANAHLDQIHDEIREDLGDAEGYDQPLSDGFTRAFERMQSSRSSPVGSGR